MSKARKVDQRYLLPETIDPPRRCLQIEIPEDENHQRAFWAAMNELTFAWVWAWDGNKTGAAVGRVWDEIVSNSANDFYFNNGGCMTYELRQNPNDNCQLQQSTDGGSTWSTVFDYSICSDIVAQTAVNNETNIYIEETNTTYNNNIVNVYPDWDYSTGDNDDQNTAMCFAVNQYVGWICDQMIGLIDLEVDQTADLFNTGALAQTATGTALLAYASFAIFPLPFFVSGLGLLAASVITTYFAGTLSSGDIEKLEDTNAREQVACLMYTAMAGSTPVYSSWETAAQGSLSGNAEFIREIVDQYNQNEDMFVQWVGFMVDAIAAANNALITDTCAANCNLWCYEFDFTSSDGGWTVMSTITDRPFGVWVDGVGWTDEYRAAGYNSDVLYIEVPIPGGRELTSVLVNFEVTGALNEANKTAQYYTRLATSNTLLIEDKTWVVGVPEDLAWAGSKVADYCGVILLPGSGLGAGTTSLVCTSVRLNGTGTNPFGANNC